jgi:hypothetical protein
VQGVKQLDTVTQNDSVTQRDTAIQRGRERGDVSDDDAVRKKLRLSELHAKNSLDIVHQGKPEDRQTADIQTEDRQTTKEVKSDYGADRCDTSLRLDPVFGSVCICRGLCDLTSTKRDAICVCSTGGRLCVIDSETGRVMCELWLPGQVFVNTHIHAL